MKYAIFQYRAGVYMPVIFPQHVTHSQVQIKDAIAVSAGFFNFKSTLFGVSVEVYGKSESLNLSPVKDRDESLLEMTLLNFETSSFLI